MYLKQQYLRVSGSKRELAERVLGHTGDGETSKSAPQDNVNRLSSSDASCLESESSDSES